MLNYKTNTDKAYFYFLKHLNMSPKLSFSLNYELQNKHYNYFDLMNNFDGSSHIAFCLNVDLQNKHR